MMILNPQKLAAFLALFVKDPGTKTQSTHEVRNAWAFVRALRERLYIATEIPGNGVPQRMDPPEGVPCLHGPEKKVADIKINLVFGKGIGLLQTFNTT